MYKPDWIDIWYWTKITFKVLWYTIVLSFSLLGILILLLMFQVWMNT